MEGSRESQGARLMPATSISRRRFLATAAAIPAALRPRPARGATAVKIGTAVLGDYSMAGPVIVARERGLFAREGLAAEFVPFRGGPDLLKAVMAGGKLLRLTRGTHNPGFPPGGAPGKANPAPTPGHPPPPHTAPPRPPVPPPQGKG